MATKRNKINPIMSLAIQQASFAPSHVPYVDFGEIEERVGVTMSHTNSMKGFRPKLVRKYRSKYYKNVQYLLPYGAGPLTVRKFIGSNIGARRLKMYKKEALRSLELIFGGSL